MRKSYIYSIITMLLIGCFVEKDIHEIEKIKIVYLEWEIFTYIRVDCDKIESYSEQLSTITTSDSIFCKNLHSNLKNMKIIESEYEPEVRIKLTIFYRKKDPDTVCIGRNKVIELNGQIVQYNEDFVKLVRDFIDNAEVEI